MSTYKYYDDDPDYSFELKAGSLWQEEDQLEEWSIRVYHCDQVIYEDWGYMSDSEAERKAEIFIEKYKESEDFENA